MQETKENQVGIYELEAPEETAALSKFFLETPWTGWVSAFYRGHKESDTASTHSDQIILVGWGDQPLILYDPEETFTDGKILSRPFDLFILQGFKM